MHQENLKPWQHEHTFGQEAKRLGEQRTFFVIVLTSVMMLAEIAAGIIFGSMALLADGLHMASHATALVINFYAYVYARKHAQDERYSFGTGKINALGGFTGAILLAVFALMMVWGSVERIFHPVSIAYNQAIFVAVLGLLVNGISVFVLGHHDDHREHEEGHDSHDHDQDHNLKSAYFHVLADALTSVLAIIALVVAKYFGFVWVDPLMGILGAILVCRWSIGLLRSTSMVLLDRQSEIIKARVKESIEAAGDNRIADLHVWALGPNIHGAVLSVVTHNPQQPQYYKELLPSDMGLVHVTIEVHKCPESEVFQTAAGR